MSTIFTIGHSTHDLGRVVALLSKYGVTAVADVRSTPGSRFAPQFNRKALERGLSAASIKYVFLGKELGARSANRADYENGQVRYDRLGNSPSFHEGLRRVLDGSHRERIALLCTERDPLDCHRTILVAQALVRLGAEVTHIHGSGEPESHSEALTRLTRAWNLDTPELLRTDAERLEEALRLQEAQIAYIDPAWDEPRETTE